VKKRILRKEAETLSDFDILLLLDTRSVDGLLSGKSSTVSRNPIKGAIVG
jgi:hypothetical protein